MDFGTAITAMRNGARVQRAGWNGKGMWLAHCSGATVVVPGGAAADYLEAQTLPFIVMRTATGEFVPWLASQTDMLALDWSVVRA